MTRPTGQPCSKSPHAARDLSSKVRLRARPRPWPTGRLRFFFFIFTMGRTKVRDQPSGHGPAVGVQGHRCDADGRTSLVCCCRCGLTSPAPGRTMKGPGKSPWVKDLVRWASDKHPEELATAGCSDCSPWPKMPQKPKRRGARRSAAGAQTLFGPLLILHSADGSLYPFWPRSSYWGPGDHADTHRHL